MSQSTRSVICGSFCSLIVLVATAGTSRADQPLHGKVFGADGAPARGAIVWAAPLFKWTPPEPRETKTDAKGEFTLALSEGNWKVWARLEREGGETTNSSKVKVKSGVELADVTIRMERRGVFRAKLIEEETDKPIVGGKLVIDNGQVLIANESGVIETSGIELSNHESFVVAPGRARKRILFDLTARPEAELEIRAPRGGKIIGEVVSAEDGRPIPHAVVGHHTSGTTFSIMALFNFCDDKGKFEWDGVGFDLPYSLTAIASGFVPLDIENTVVDGEPSPEVVFRLKRDPAARAAGVKNDERKPSESLRDIGGTVRGPGGKPVAKAIVRWGATNADPGGSESLTDADGSFVLKNIPDRPGRLSVLAGGLAPQFPAVDKGPKPIVEVVLEPGREVSGKVVDTGGFPVKGVSVTPVIPSPDPNIGNPFWLVEYQGVTDGDGAFHLTGIPRFGVTFDFLGSGRSAKRNKMLSLDGKQNVIVIESEGAIRGRVVDSNGKPVRNFRVLFLHPTKIEKGERPGSYFAGYCGIGVNFTGDDGTFIVSALEAGAVHRLAIVAKGHGVGYAEHVIAEPITQLSPAENLTIKLSAPHRLAVKVVDSATNRPIPRARITLVYGDPSLDKQFSWGYHDVSWMDMYRTRTDDKGEKELSSLAFEGATILVRAEGYARRRIAWRDGNESIEVKMEREAFLSGEVRDRDGKLVDEIRVGLTNDHGDSMNAMIDPLRPGRFKIGELPAGNYHLSLYRSFGARFDEKDIVLKVGEVKILPIWGVDPDRTRNRMRN
jgi:hypothetical protein